MSPRVRVAAADPEQAEQTRALHAMLLEERPGDCDPAYSVERWHKRLTRYPGRTHLAWAADEVVGMSDWDEPLNYWGEHELEMAELTLVVVEPAYRRAGVASQLIQAALEGVRAASYQNVQCWIEAQDAQVQALVAKHGFALSEQHEDEQVWARALAS